MAVTASRTPIARKISWLPRWVRIGVVPPDTTDPDRVAAYVLGRFAEPPAEVEQLVERAADEAQRFLDSNECSAPS